MTEPERPSSPAHVRALLARVDADRAAAHLRLERLEQDAACCSPHDAAELAAKMADAEATILELKAERERVAPAEPARSPANDTVPPLPASAACVGTREAARLLGVSPRTLEGLRARGEGPPCERIGRRVVYPLATLRSSAK